MSTSTATKTPPTIRAELSSESVTASSTSPVETPFVLAVDSREQLPYTFVGLKADAKDGHRPLEVRTAIRGLAAGDYSICDYENEVAIERKSLSDLYGTLGRGRQRFERELERLNEMTFAAVMIEASWPEIVFHPPPGSKMRPKCIARSIFAFTVRFTHVHWFCMGSRKMAEAATYRLLERFWKDRTAKIAEDEMA